MLAAWAAQSRVALDRMFTVSRLPMPVLATRGLTSVTLLEKKVQLAQCLQVRHGAHIANLIGPEVKVGQRRQAG